MLCRYYQDSEKPGEIPPKREHLSLCRGMVRLAIEKSFAPA